MSKHKSTGYSTWYTILVAGAIFVAGLALLALARPEKMGPPLAAAINATVKLSNDEGGGGSGVVIGPHTIITAYHVIDGQTHMTVTLADNSKHDGTITFTDKSHDLALVQVADKLPAPMTISCDSLKIGDPIAIIGSPMLVAEMATYGRVAARGLVKIEDNPQSYLALDAAAAPGNSGGAVIDLATGRLVGITDAVLLAPVGFNPSITGIALAIPATTYCSLLPTR